MGSVSKAFKDFILTISLKKRNALGQSTEAPPVVTIDYYILEVVCDFTYLGMTITYSLSLDKEIDKRIGKAATTLTPLTTRVSFSMFTLLRQCRLCRLGHVHCMHYGSIAKDTVWRIGIWEEKQWPSPATIQRCHEERHKSWSQ